jgi:hypothetical protein
MAVVCQKKLQKKKNATWHMLISFHMAGFIGYIIVLFIMKVNQKIDPDHLPFSTCADELRMTDKYSMIVCIMTLK